MEQPNSTSVGNRVPDKSVLKTPLAPSRRFLIKL